MRLEGRRALVTGGSRSIGQAIAVGLAREGADVVVNYRQDRQAAERTAAAIRAHGRQAAVVQGDTSVRADVDRLVREAIGALGAIDLLVNNAGVLKRTPLLEIEEREWDWILDTNLKGYFLVSQAVARHMVAQRIPGVIVNTSSAGQAVAAPNLTHYCVAKAGIEMLTKQLALELAAHRIRVNAICPGLIETDLNRADIADPAFRERRLARIPLKQIGVPDDVVGAVVFLAATPESRLVTGASLFIDGGQTIWGA
jgi:NAD(P)-dependent dehydrogenase (short-subunit alcohol dehydrogenase family)